MTETPSNLPDPVATPPEAKPTSPEATSTQPEAKATATSTEVKAAPPKAKPPVPEDKPFDVFVPESLLPALVKEIEAYGGPAPELVLEQGAMPVVGADCWMLRGSLPGERRFWLCFTRPDISSAKTIALAEGSASPSLLESFLIDEKKMTMSLLVSRVVQRLNAQKWLGPN